MTTTPTRSTAHSDHRSPPKSVKSLARPKSLPANESMPQKSSSSPLPLGASLEPTPPPSDSLDLSAASLSASWRNRRPTVAIGQFKAASNLAQIGQSHPGLGRTDWAGARRAAELFAGAPHEPLARSTRPLSKPQIAFSNTDLGPKSACSLPPSVCLFLFACLQPVTCAPKAGRSANDGRHSAQWQIQ